MNNILVVETTSLAAYYSLIEIGKLQKGQRLFINGTSPSVHRCVLIAHLRSIKGGSTAVGMCAIQIAKYFGAYVVVSCSARNMDFVRELGADEVLVPFYDPIS